MAAASYLAVPVARDEHGGLVVDELLAPVDQLVREYRPWLLCDRGLAPVTVRAGEQLARRFLANASMRGTRAACSGSRGIARFLGTLYAASRSVGSSLPPAASRMSGESKSTSAASRSARVALPANWCW
jgi:hypothetical protein